MVDSVKTPTADDRLAEWLEENNALELWSERITAVGTLTAFLVNGRQLMVVRWRGQRADGWEIFRPVSDKSDIATILAAATAYVKAHHY